MREVIQLVMCVSDTVRAEATACVTATRFTASQGTRLNASPKLISGWLSTLITERSMIPMNAGTVVPSPLSQLAPAGQIKERTPGANQRKITTEKSLNSRSLSWKLAAVFLLKL